MAPKKAQPTSQGIAQSFGELAAAAAQLNAASDELATAIAPIDTALKKLNIGVMVWHRYVGGGDAYGEYWARRIGYTKLGGKWGVALAAASGSVSDPDEDCEEWLFNDAPRWMRIEAVDHLPSLLEAIATEVSKTTESLAKKTEQVRALYAGLSTLADTKERR